MSTLAYDYIAVDSFGKEQRGSVRGSDEQDAYRKITLSGLTPLRLTPIKERASLFAFQRVNLTDIVNLTRELSVLVEARIPLDRGLVSIAEHEPKPELAAMIRDIATQIEAGAPLTVAIEKYRSTFGDVYIETLRAAEKSGNLKDVMAHLAEMLERQMETRQQVKRALSYPVIVMCVVAVAMTIIVGFVVPKFAKTFAMNGATLPLATRIIQAIGISVQNYWWAYTLGLAAIIATVITTWRSPSGRRVYEEFFLRVPWLSKLIVSVTTARFARVLSISLSSGLDIIESLEVAGRSTGRPIFIKETAEMAGSLRQGERLADALRPSRYLPSFAKRMVGAGKDSKEVSRACDIIARHYDREASHLTKNVNTIVEPLMTVALAGIVLVVALSVFLPMWQMVRIRK